MTFGGFSSPLCTIGTLTFYYQLCFQIANLLLHRPYKHLSYLADGGQQFVRPPVYSSVSRTVGVDLRPLVSVL